MHRFDRRAVVHALAVPLATARFGGDLEAFFTIQHAESQRFIGDVDRRCASLSLIEIVSAETSLTVIGNAAAVGAREDEQSIVGGREPVIALVHEPVMETAERDEIRELRLPSVG
jgi:hypothetical protein